MTVGLEYMHTRAAGISSRLLKKDIYENLSLVDSIMTLISSLDHTSYAKRIAKYFIEKDPIISFTTAIFEEANSRITILMKNTNETIYNKIQKIQYVIDIKNILVLLNIMRIEGEYTPNELKRRSESFISSLSSGGNININIWYDLVNEPQIDKLIAKSLFLAPNLYPFLNRIKKLHNTHDPLIDLISIETITEISIKEIGEIFIPAGDPVYQTILHDISLLTLRYLSRHKKELETPELFLRLKNALKPWSNVEGFLFGTLLKSDLYYESLLRDIIQTINQELVFHANWGIPHILEQEDIDLADIESLLNKIIFKKLESQSRFLHESLGKVILIVLKIIQEAKNLSWLAFGIYIKFPSQKIMERVFVP